MAGAGCPPAVDGAGKPLLADLGWPGWGGVRQKQRREVQKEQSWRGPGTAQAQRICPFPVGTG
jgi:hypothetical protein